MAKRYLDTEIWREDWFLDLDGREQLFWVYICSTCDHAGIWRVNTRMFEVATSSETGGGFRIEKEKFIEHVNKQKERIFVVDSSKWFIVDFIRFQYQTSKLVEKNSVHRGVIKRLTENAIHYEIYGYIVDPTKGLPRPYQGSKDKDKDISLDSKDVNALKATDKDKATTRAGTYNTSKPYPDQVRAQMSPHRRRVVEAYPKKTAHLASISEWAQAVVGMTETQEAEFADKCIVTIERWKRSEDWKNPTYIPDLRSWLKDGRWDDVVPARVVGVVGKAQC